MNNNDDNDNDNDVQIIGYKICHLKENSVMINWKMSHRKL